MYEPEQDFTGRYTLKQHLGSGGFGEVWKAYDHTIKKDVAIKILAPNTRLSAKVIGACSEEYKNTLDIHHPHLLTPNYFDIHEGKMYLVMPLCEGGSLASYLYRGVLKEDDVYRLIRELGAGLAYLHGEGLLHNDIKPDNILLSKPLSEGGTFLLTDFGISTRLRNTVRKSTKSSDIKGLTQAYSAPELFGSTPKQSKATDVFSFGVMLYECCAGDVPWQGMGGMVLNSDGAVVPQLPDGYSPALNHLVQSCMALNPAERPSAEILSKFDPSDPDISEMIKRLEEEKKKREEEEQKKKEEEEQKRLEKKKTKTVYIGNVPMKMVYVEGGAFTMGCTSEQSDCGMSDE